MKNRILLPVAILACLLMTACSKKSNSTAPVAPDYTAGIAAGRVWEGSRTNDTTAGTINTSVTSSIVDTNVAITVVDKTHLMICGLTMPFQSIDSANKVKYFGGNDMQVIGITGEGSANLAWYYGADSVSYTFITSKGTIGFYMDMHTR